MSYLDSRDRRRSRRLVQRLWSSVIGNASHGLVVGLLLTSFFMCWRGITEFVAARSAETPDLLTEIGVAFVVFILTLAMFVALREVLAWRSWRNGILALALYSGLMLLSVSFGYGFWWSLIAGREATEASLTASIKALDEGIARATTRLNSAAQASDQLANLSKARADVEKAVGGSCGSPPEDGEGPLFIRRGDVDLTLQSSAASLRADWIEPIQKAVDKLHAAETEALAVQPQNLRRGALENVARQAHALANDVENKQAAYGPRFAAQFRPMAAELSIRPGEPGFSCYDPGLAKGLDEAALAVSQDMSFRVPEFVFAEGREGTALAVMRFWTGVLQTPNRIVTALGRLASGEPAPLADINNGRNLAALGLAFGVDLSLLYFTFAGPRGIFGRGGPASDIKASDQARLRKVLDIAIRRDVETTRRVLSLCLMTLKGVAYFILPAAEGAPPRLRGQIEAFDNVASTLTEHLGERFASPRWHPNAYEAARRRLEDLGWSSVKTSDLELYRLSRGAFSAIRAEIWADQPPRDEQGAIRAEGETGPTPDRPPTVDELWARWPGRLGQVGVAPPRDGVTQTARPQSPMSEEELDSRWFELRQAQQLAAASPDRADDARLADLLRVSFEAMSREAGLTLVGREGERFDPYRHQAVEARDDAGARNTILEVLRPGYEKRGKLVRPAWVVVSQGPSV